MDIATPSNSWDPSKYDEVLILCTDESIVVSIEDIRKWKMLVDLHFEPNGDTIPASLDLGVSRYTVEFMIKWYKIYDGINAPAQELFRYFAPFPWVRTEILENMERLCITPEKDATLLEFLRAKSIVGMSTHNICDNLNSTIHHGLDMKLILKTTSAKETLSVKNILKYGGNLLAGAKGVALVRAMLDFEYLRSDPDYKFAVARVVFSSTDAFVEIMGGPLRNYIEGTSRNKNDFSFHLMFDSPDDSVISGIITEIDESTLDRLFEIDEGENTLLHHMAKFGMESSARALLLATVRYRRKIGSLAYDILFEVNEAGETPFHLVRNYKMFVMFYGFASKKDTISSLATKNGKTIADSVAELDEAKSILRFMEARSDPDGEIDAVQVDDFCDWEDEQEEFSGTASESGSTGATSE